MRGRWLELTANQCFLEPFGIAEGAFTFWEDGSVTTNCRCGSCGEKIEPPAKPSVPPETGA